VNDQRLKPLREAIAEDCMASREAAAWNARSNPLDQDLSAALARVAAARRFPHNMDVASRHVELIAETAPEHEALSMLSVVASLYEARNEVGMMDRLARKSAIDAAVAERAKRGHKINPRIAALRKARGEE
jgi:hypothetical protein